MLRTTLLALFLAGCALSPSESADQNEADLTLDPAATARVLALVNYPGTELSTLDVDAALDKRAAQGIVAHRNGVDGVSPSGDDDAFDALDELTKISYVGATALKKLDAYALAHPPPASATVEGVVFQGWQTEAVVWGVNHAADANQLKATLGLTITQASSLVAARPFTTVAQIGATKNIGSASLYMLRNGSIGFWNSMHYACTTSFGSISAPDVESYSSQLIAYDGRGDQYAYQTGARSVPKCIDATKIEMDLRALLLDFAGWTQTAKDFPQNMQYGPLTMGSSVFHSFLDATLSHMDEFRADRVGNGDPNAQAGFDALKAAYLKMAYIVEMHAAGTYSMQIRIEASECSEKAVLFIDAAQGIVLMMHQPPQC